MSGEEITFNTSDSRENIIKRNFREKEHTSRIKVWVGQVIQYRVRSLIFEYFDAYFSEQQLFFKCISTFKQGPVKYN
jgi:hypothetical protein